MSDEKTPKSPDSPAAPEHVRGNVTRARILDAARDLFTEKGYEKVSLREVAEVVGLTKAALYYYFPTKEKMFEALVEPFFGMQQVVYELLATPPNGESWAAALTSFLDWILEQRKLFELVQSNQTTFHELMHQVGHLEQHTAMHDRVNEALSDESVPLAARVRVAGATMFVIGIVAFPAGGPFSKIPVEELRPVVLDAINDLLLPR
jgi:AcrR family transcriptional regulator